MGEMSVDLALAAARNLATHSTWIQARAKGMRAHVTPRLSMGDSGLPTDTFNIISAARLTGRRSSREVQRAIDWYGARPFSWWVSPGDLPTDLPWMLGAAGLHRVEEETAMTCDLGLLEDSAEWPQDLSVTRVRTPSDLKAFAELLARLSDPPDIYVREFYASAASCLLTAECPLRLYLGRLNGARVATSEVTLAHGVAGLYNVSTAKPQRRQGIGRAMSVLPLLEARADGARFGVLQAAGEARGVYSRVGFASVGVVAEYKPGTAG